MLAKVLSAALVGIDAHLIDVEVDIAGGLPQFSVVGLPDATVRESRDRVRSALKNTGFHFPAKKITVNLAPAGIKKEGSGLDLAIAIGILVAEEVIPPQNVQVAVCVGELSLDGHIKAITGALSIGIACRPDHSLLLPAENSQEAADGAGRDSLSAPHAPRGRGISQWHGFADSGRSRPTTGFLPRARWRMRTMAM